MGLIDVMKNLPGWAKILGISGGGILILVVILIYISGQPGGEQAVKVPSTLEDIKDNTTETLRDAEISTSKEAATSITSSFNKIGEEQAKQVKDPATASSIKYLWGLAGLFLAAFVVLMVIKAFEPMISAMGKLFPQ